MWITFTLSLHFNPYTWDTNLPHIGRGKLYRYHIITLQLSQCYTVKLIGMIWIITGTIPTLLVPERMTVRPNGNNLLDTIEQYGNSCSLCGKWLSMGTSWKLHMMTHTGEKPYECEMCGKRFTQKANLVRHTRMHTGEKPFKCDVCDLAFKKNDNLKHHKMINHQQ